MTDVKGSKVIVETNGDDVVITLGCGSHELARECCMEIHHQIMAGLVQIWCSNTTFDREHSVLDA